jgi:hypothetical protein
MIDVSCNIQEPEWAGEDTSIAGPIFLDGHRRSRAVPCPDHNPESRPGASAQKQINFLVEIPGEGERAEPLALAYRRRSTSILNWDELS